MKIAIDIDGTISNTDTAFHEIITKKINQYGYDCYFMQYYRYSEVEAQAFQAAKPIPKAKETIEYLLENGHNITFLTARNNKNVAITEQWLKENGFPNCEVVFRTDKKNYLRENEFDLLIDDTNYLVYKEKFKWIKPDWVEIRKTI